MRRTLILTAAALALAACMPPAVRIGYVMQDAMKEERAGDYAKCAETYGKAVEMARKAQEAAGSEERRLQADSSLAGASMGLGGCLTQLGKKEEAKPHLERCLTVSADVVERAGRLPPPRDLPEQIQKASLSWGGHLNRAYCLKSLGRLPEAVAEREASIPFVSELCGMNWTLGTKSIGEGFCRTAADETEGLAKWKKDLAKK